MKNITLSSLHLNLDRAGHKLRPYVSLAFFLLFAGIYGFMILKIDALSNAPLNTDAASEEVKAAPAPRIDVKASEQLQTLKDNSVNVQTLFEQERTNPFQE